MSGRLVVVGAAQAGARAVEAIRASGFAGPVALIGAEPHLPYERPPLSKAVLLGEAEPEVCRIHPEAWYRDNDIDLRLATRVEAIDRERRRLRLSDGRELAYERLLLATGSVVRRLSVPGSEHPRVRYLRSIDDALAIRAHLAPGARVLIVGGGYIGLEVAAAARKRGAEVTVLEAAPRVLARGVAPEVAEFVAELHRRHGVVIRTGTTLARVEAGAESLRAHSADGETWDAELVVVGIGVRPETALAEAAGLEVDDGILVDETTRTSDPAIFAAGDVTRHPSPRLGRRVRLESWANAQNQAIVAGRVMAGVAAVYDEVPWFWTEQYEVMVQLVGLPDRWERTVLRGAREEARFALFYLHEGRLVGAALVGMPREVQIARRLIERAATVAPERLGDPEVPLRQLLKSG